MVITPLIDRLGGMWDYMASARQAGVRTVFPVHSWDNLSSKARIIHVPDRVLVWNETQVEEAKKFHGIPGKRIQVTGAQGFDDWFAMAPSTSREEFCDALSFNPDRPILLYVCSAILKRHMAPSIASEKTELAFFTRWISALRSSSDDRLREANVIIRPHPKREAQWDDVDLSSWGAVKVFPRHGRLPNDRSSKAIFFDSIFHSAAVIGINTSAMIEAGIIGRPVMTILDPDYAGGQVEMQHFQYLLKVGEGLLITAETYEEHLQQLSNVLNNPAITARRIADFTERFVRPLGRDRLAAPVAARAILDVACQGPGRRWRRGAMHLRLEQRMAKWSPVPRVTPDHWQDMSATEVKRRLARRQARRLAREKKRVEPSPKARNKCTRVRKSCNLPMQLRHRIIVAQRLLIGDAIFLPLASTAPSPSLDRNFAALKVCRRQQRSTRREAAGYAAANRISPLG